MLRYLQENKGARCERSHFLFPSANFFRRPLQEALFYFGATGGRVRTTFHRSPFHRRPRLRRHMTEPSESESTSEWIALTAAEAFLGT